MMVMEPYPGTSAKIGLCQCATFYQSQCKSLILPCGWHAPTATRSKRLPETVWVFWRLVSLTGEAKNWSKIYYDIIKSEECVPLGHTVNANIAMVSAFSLHEDHDEAARRGEDGFRFFEYALVH